MRVRRNKNRWVLALATLCWAAATPFVVGQETKGKDAKESKDSATKPVEISLADGKITMKSPEGWESKTPRFPQMIKYEFVIPAGAKEGEPTARITFSAAGGSVDANVSRWKSQFESLDKKSEVTKFEASKQTVHWADLRGSFKDTMGAPPFAGRPPKIREGYRMLGAIIETKEAGLQFVKVIGPAVVVDKYAEATKKMLKELKAN